MPAPDVILEGLSQIAGALWPAAVAWHVVIAAGLAAVLAGWRPSRRLAALLLAAPLLSVSAAAWAVGNSFNGAVLLVLAVALGTLGVRLGGEPVRRGPAWMAVAGAVLVAFGWVYPHFVEHGGPLRYLYAAPTGLLPCPTLALVIGLTLVAGGFGSRAFALVLAAAGLFYGLSGALRLGVHIDAALVAGAAVLIGEAASVPRAQPRVAGAAT